MRVVAPSLRKKGATPAIGVAVHRF